MNNKLISKDLDSPVCTLRAKSDISKTCKIIDYDTYIPDLENILKPQQYEEKVKNTLLFTSIIKDKFCGVYIKIKIDDEKYLLSLSDTLLEYFVNEYNIKKLDELLNHKIKFKS